MGETRRAPADAVYGVPDYDEDLVAWALANAALLRAGRFSEIDADHLAEELEDLGKSERRALCSHIRILVLHLLKWELQPGLRGASWRLSIQNARREIEIILEDSPSLKASASLCLQKEYPWARRNAVIETGLREEHFPSTSPYTVEQVLDPHYWP